MRRLKTLRRPPIYPKTPGHLPCSSLTHPLPLSSRRPSVSFGGFGIRLRSERKDHVWSYDFVAARTADGRAFRILGIVDEYTRECLAMVVKRSITSQDVLDQLDMLFLVRGVPEHIRSDNGPEFTSKAVREWLSNLGVMALFIEPGSPWENGYVESFNGKLRDEFLNGELFNTLAEARILIEWWKKEYNQVRPHSALGYRPPAPQTIMPAMA